MRANYRVVLDACVLANYSVCDLYLRLTEDVTRRMFLPRWSEEILAEVARTQLDKLNWPKELVESFREAIDEHFPEALVEGYERLIPLCENDPKDRHVLATAIHCQAQTIITFNLRDFRQSALESWQISAVHPGEYLCTLYDHDSGYVVAKLEEISERRKTSLGHTLVALKRSIPTFAALVMEELGVGEEP